MLKVRSGNRDMGCLHREPGPGLRSIAKPRKEANGAEEVGPGGNGPGVAALAVSHL